MRIVVTAIGIGLTAASLGAQASRPYDFSVWPKGSTRLAGFDLGAWSLTGLKGGAVAVDVHAWQTDDPDRPRVAVGPYRRLFVDTGHDTKCQFVVTMYVRRTQLEANAQMARWIIFVESDMQLPKAVVPAPAPAQPKSIGDVGFEVDASCIVFARDNIAVQVRRLPEASPTPSLHDVAAKLDLAIQQRPAGEIKPAAPDFKVPATCKVEQSVALTDVPATDGSIRWIVGGEGQGYVESVPAGGWRLVTTKAGPLVVTLVVTTRHGWSAYSSRHVHVTST